MSRSSKRQPQNNYKSIHMKNLNLGNKSTSQQTNDKNIQYFPTRLAKRQSNQQLEISKSNTNRQCSETSRYSKRESNFTGSVQQGNRSIMNENDKLKKELKKYEKMLLEKQDNASSSKHLELELVETYRVIHYYEGKVKELQRTCRQYEKQFENIEGKKSKSAKFAAILEDLRNSNSQLSGKNEQKTMQINLVTAQLRKMESKFHSSQQIIIELNKKVGSNRFTSMKPKFIDDYQQKNLNFQSEPEKQQLVKRRPEISRSKRIIRTPQKGQSDSDASGISSQYKNSVYIKRKENSKSKEDILRSSKHKSLAFGNISSRLNTIQNEIESIKKENERLHQQLDLKVKEISKLREQNQAIQIKLRATFPQDSNELKTVTISKEKLKEIPNPFPNSTPRKNQQNNLASYVTNISMSSQNNKVSVQSNQKFQKPVSQRIKPHRKVPDYVFKEVKPRTIRKLIMNLVRQDITYFNLIDNITQAWTSQNPNSLIELLQELPYQLNSVETSEFMFEYKNIMKFISSKERQAAHKDMNQIEYKKSVSEEIKTILKDNIAYFKNITIRRDYTLNIQLSNKFKNYQKQIEEIMKRYGNKMPFSQIQPIFVNKWGLTAQEILFLQVKNYEQHEDIDFIHIADLGRYFLLE